MSQFLYLKKTSIPSWVTVDQRILRLHWLRRTLLNTQIAQDNKKPNNKLSFYVIFIEMLIIISFYRLTLLQKLLQILFLRIFFGHDWLSMSFLPLFPQSSFLFVSLFLNVYLHVKNENDLSASPENINP